LNYATHSYYQATSLPGTVVFMKSAGAENTKCHSFEKKEASINKFDYCGS